MAGYLFTVKDRQTDEILCQGSAQECADFIGCKNSYIRDLTRKQPEYKINHKYSAYKVERQVVGEVKRGGAHKKDVICCDCGVLMVNACVLRKRCPECQKKHETDARRERMRRMRETGLVASPKIQNENNNYCEGCKHFRGEFVINQCCNYLFDTGKRRPCPPGKDCTVKVKRRGYREKKERSTTTLKNEMEAI